MDASTTDGAQRYAIGELAELTRVSRRTVHFYVQRRLIDPPLGLGRGRHYDARHAAQILRVRELQRRGVPLSAMADGVLPTAVRHDATYAGALATFGGAVTPVLRVRVDDNVTVEVAADCVAMTPELLADLTSAVSAIIDRHRGVREAGGGAMTGAAPLAADSRRAERSGTAAGRPPGQGPGTRLQGEPEEEEEEEES